jgi:hypothetical protein
MKTATNQFPPIDQETRSHVETACAAHWLIRKNQTLRTWACLGTGPIRPVRIMGRLAWPVDAIKHVLKCGAAAGTGAPA